MPRTVHTNVQQRASIVIRIIPVNMHSNTSAPRVVKWSQVGTPGENEDKKKKKIQQLRTGELDLHFSSSAACASACCIVASCTVSVNYVIMSRQKIALRNLKVHFQS